MSNDNKTLADVQPGGRVRLEKEPRDHRWDDVGERCLDCGDKDWMGGACSGPRSTAATGPWLSITNAPNDGQQHIRGLWVTSRIDGKPDTREWRQFIGVVNDEGAFVDPDYGETFGWEADEYDAWMPAAVAPGAALSAQPSPGGQDVLFIEELAELRRLVPSVNQKHALDAAIAALSARQPVGEPVAWMTHHDEPMLFPTAAEASAYCEDDEQPVPLFRSPAQAVDLGQLPRAVELLSNVSRTLVDWAAEEQREAIGIVKALIDSQAVGNG